MQTRLKKAIEGAGLAAGGVGDAGRRLFVLRSAGWPSGPVTEKAAAEFAAKGGVLLPVAESDLKTFAALGELLAGHHPELNAWLLARRPAHGDRAARPRPRRRRRASRADANVAVADRRRRSPDAGPGPG